MSRYSDRLKNPKWQKLRLEVFNRDRFSCRFCGDKDKTLNVHHLEYNGEPWDTPLDRLITLCERCHSECETIIKLVRDEMFCKEGLDAYKKITWIIGHGHGYAMLSILDGVLDMVYEQDLAKDGLENHPMKKRSK